MGRHRPPGVLRPELRPGGGGGDPFAGLFGLAFSPTHRIVFLYYVILALALLTICFVHAHAPPAAGPRLGCAA